MRTPLRLAGSSLALGLALGLAGCSHENDKATDESAEPSDSAVATTPAAPGTYPAFAPENYVYRLEVLCFCPQVGAVRVTVTDGKVASAKAVSGKSRGSEAPKYLRLTINDIIDRANDPKIDHAEVTWPAGQDHPSGVRLDQLSGATDDEVTYTIGNVRISGE